MRVGTLISIPNSYTQYARVTDQYGASYTVDPSSLPEDASEGEEFAYKVEIWGNDSGLAYDLV